MDKKIINLLKTGGVGVIPTDTLYGLVGSAFDKKAVAKIYQLKKRSPEKPFIILISSLADLKKFQIIISPKTASFLEKIWPNPISVILPCNHTSLFYLHRGTNTLALRIPNDKKLLSLLRQTGPLVAPSANSEGEPVAETILEAQKYFQNSVDFYADGGTLQSLSSTLIKLENDQIQILRQGAVDLAAYGAGEAVVELSVGDKAAEVGVGITPVGGV